VAADLPSELQTITTIRKAFRLLGAHRCTGGVFGLFKDSFVAGTNQEGENGFRVHCIPLAFLAVTVTWIGFMTSFAACFKFGWL
jgi:hypothetical protein